MKKSSLFTVFMVVFIGLMGFSFFIPILPFYAVDFGANEVVVGLLLSSYAIAQFFGAPLLGRLSDRYGRRPVLLISSIGTLISLLMLAFAQSLLVLFISRIVDGLTGGNIAVAQAYVTDITDEKNRAKGLGLLGAAFGLGFIIGPALGGILSSLGDTLVNPAITESSATFLQQFDWKYTLPGLGAALIGFINVLQIIFTLPESLTEERRAELQASEKAKGRRRILDPGAIWQATRRPHVGPLLNLRFFFGLAFVMFEMTFPLFVAARFGLGAAETAAFLTYIGVLLVIIQGYAVGKLTDRFNERTLLVVALLLMSGSLLAWALSVSIMMLLLVLIPMAFAGGIFNTLINSTLTKAADPREAGNILGISASIESITRIIAPVLGNMLIAFGAWMPGVLGAIITGFAAYYTYERIYKTDQPRKRKVEET